MGFACVILNWHSETWGLVSAHLPDSSAQRVFEEKVLALQVFLQNPPHPVDVWFVGVDANAMFAATYSNNFPAPVGYALSSIVRQHPSAHTFYEFLCTNNLIALNTHVEFDPDHRGPLCTWTSNATGDEDPRDFMLVSGHKAPNCTTLHVAQDFFGSISDHKPIIWEVEAPPVPDENNSEVIKSHCHQHWKLCVFKWAPRNLKHFQTSVRYAIGAVLDANGTPSQVATALGATAVQHRQHQQPVVDNILDMLHQHINRIVQTRSHLHTPDERKRTMWALRRLWRCCRRRKRALRARAVFSTPNFKGLTKLDLASASASTIPIVSVPHAFQQGSIVQAAQELADGWTAVMAHHNTDLDQRVFQQYSLEDSGAIFDRDGFLFGIVNGKEMRKASFRMHSGKAADTFSVNAEILRASPLAVHQYSAELLRTKLRNVPVQNQPRNPLRRRNVQFARLRMSPKTPRAAQALAFRPLLLQMAFLKQQGVWFQFCVKPYLCRLLPDYFFGFIPDRQAAEMQFCTQILVERSIEFCIDLFLFKGDIWKFFDCVTYQQQFLAMTKRGVPDNVASYFVRETMSTDLEIQLPDNIGPKLRIRPHRCVPQGHPTSAQLSVAVIADVITPLVASWQERGLGIELISRFLCTMFFADDGWAFASNWGHFQIMVTELVLTLETHGFQMQLAKTGWMTTRDDSWIAHLVIQGVSVPRVSRELGLLQLGRAITADGHAEQCVRKSIVNASNYMHDRKVSIHLASVSRNARLHFAAKVSQQVVQWGCQFCTLTTNLARDLDVAQRRIFRSVARVPRLPGEEPRAYLHRANTIVHTELAKHSLSLQERWSETFQRRKFEFAGHISRHDDISSSPVRYSSLASEVQDWNSLRFSREMRASNTEPKHRTGRPVRWEAELFQWGLICHNTHWQEIARCSTTVQWNNMWPDFQLFLCRPYRERYPPALPLHQCVACGNTHNMVDPCWKGPGISENIWIRSQRNDGRFIRQLAYQPAVDRTSTSFIFRFDGAVFNNQDVTIRKAASGVVFYTPGASEPRSIRYQYLGNHTSMYSEFYGALVALASVQAMLDIDPTPMILVEGDNKVVIDTLSGNAALPVDSELRLLATHVRSYWHYVRYYGCVCCRWTPRARNYHADYVAKFSAQTGSTSDWVDLILV